MSAPNPDNDRGAMAVLGRTLCEARVSLYNLKKFDVATGDPVLAKVTPPSSDDRIGGRLPLAMLVPLTAVVLLRNAARAEAVAAPMMQLIGLAADQMVEGVEAARAMRLREQVDTPPEQALDSDPEVAAAGLLGLGLPEPYQGPGRPDKVFRAQIRVGRSGAPFGAVRG